MKQPSLKHHNYILYLTPSSWFDSCRGYWCSGEWCGLFCIWFYHVSKKFEMAARRTWKKWNVSKRNWHPRIQMTLQKTGLKSCICMYILKMLSCLPKSSVWNNNVSSSFLYIYRCLFTYSNQIGKRFLLSYIKSVFVDTCKGVINQT